MDKIKNNKGKFCCLDCKLKAQKKKTKPKKKPSKPKKK